MNQKTIAAAAEKHLTNEQIEMAQRWVAAGARWTVRMENEDKMELVHNVTGDVLLQVMSWGDVYENTDFRDAAPAPKPARVVINECRIENHRSGTTHAINGWGESFCGRFHRSDDSMRAERGRVTMTTTTTINYREEVRDFVREFPGANTAKLWQLGESGLVPWSEVYEVARKALQVAVEEARESEEASDDWCDVCGDTREWCPR